MNFLKGNIDGFKQLGDGSSSSQKASIIRDNMAKVLDSKNLSFLMGSGCSSLICCLTGTELGIPTMKPLAEEFQSVITRNKKIYGIEISQENVENIKTELGIDITSESIGKNLEELLSVLASAGAFCRNSKRHDINKMNDVVENAITFIKGFILSKCSNEEFFNDDNKILNIYTKFYRSLANRARGLSPPWVFTTNYDLFNETAMDRSNVPYSNGFSGNLERKFNPSSYRFTLAEELDIASRRWATVRNFVHFCKLHGSINWVEEEEYIYKIREHHQKIDLEKDRVMIYPISSKQSASLETPYSDMFREFHRQVVQNQSSLVVLGYGFGDEHINNIIFQGLTLPNFKLIIFGDPNVSGPTRKLQNLADPRIWFIWDDCKRLIEEDDQSRSGLLRSTKKTLSTAIGLCEKNNEEKGSNISQRRTNPIHYFDQVVEHFLPIDEDKEDTSKIIEESIRVLFSKEKEFNNAKR